MRIGPKYKIARRLGAPVFEKTQSQKYALSQARKEKSGKSFMRPKSEFGIQLLEKQKARYTYCLTERQFSRYAKEALAKRGTNVLARFFEMLELRADNVAYRAGLAGTRLSARQLVSHGHITVNGRRITIPSYKLSVGDVLSVRPGSKEKRVFADLSERLSSYRQPSWLSFDEGSMTAKVITAPKLEESQALFNLRAILEFYSR